jgi:hypothetical protein
MMNLTTSWLIVFVFQRMYWFRNVELQLGACASPSNRMYDGDQNTGAN